MLAAFFVFYNFIKTMYLIGIVCTRLQTNKNEMVREGGANSEGSCTGKKDELSPKSSLT